MSEKDAVSDGAGADVAVVAVGADVADVADVAGADVAGADDVADVAGADAGADDVGASDAGADDVGASDAGADAASKNMVGGGKSVASMSFLQIYRKWIMKYKYLLFIIVSTISIYIAHTRKSLIKVKEMLNSLVK